MGRIIAALYKFKFVSNRGVGGVGGAFTFVETKSMLFFVLRKCNESTIHKGHEICKGDKMKRILRRQETTNV